MVRGEGPGEGAGVSGSEEDGSSWGGWSAPVGGTLQEYCREFVFQGGGGGRDAVWGRRQQETEEILRRTETPDGSGGVG